MSVVLCHVRYEYWIIGDIRTIRAYSFDFLRDGICSVLVLQTHTITCRLALNLGLLIVYLFQLECVELTFCESFCSILICLHSLKCSMNTCILRSQKGIIYCTWKNVFTCSCYLWSVLISGISCSEFAAMVLFDVNKFRIRCRPCKCAI